MLLKNRCASKLLRLLLNLHKQKYVILQCLTSNVGLHKDTGHITLQNVAKIIGVQLKIV